MKRRVRQQMKNNLLALAAWLIPVPRCARYGHLPITFRIPSGTGLVISHHRTFPYVTSQVQTSPRRNASTQLHWPVRCCGLKPTSSRSSWAFTNNRQSKMQFQVKSSKYLALYTRSDIKLDTKSSRYVIVNMPQMKTIWKIANFFFLTWS